MQGRIAQLIIAQPLEQRKADKKTAHLKTHDQRGKKGTTLIPVQKDLFLPFHCLPVTQLLGMYCSQ
jgi:hypothetical protein